MTNVQQLKTHIAAIVVDDSACEIDDLAPCGGVQVTVPAMEVWDAFVERAVTSDWVGVEALSGITGTVGDAVRHNVSAFGQSIADTLFSVRTWDRANDAQRTLPLAACDFRPGASRMAETMSDGSERFEILGVAFLFRQGDLTTPIRDESLTEMLGADAGARVPLSAVRERLLQRNS